MKVHPSPAITQVLVSTWVSCGNTSVLPHVFQPKESPHWLQAEDCVSHGSWHGALTGEQEVRIHKTGQMKSPAPRREVERAEPSLPVWQLQRSPQNWSHTLGASHRCVFTWVMKLQGEGSCKRSAEAHSSHSEGSWHPHQVQSGLPGTWPRSSQSHAVAFRSSDSVRQMFVDWNG